MLIEEPVRLRSRRDSLIIRTGQAGLPLQAGAFRAVSFRSQLDGTEHFALVLGGIAAADPGPDGVLVRMHSECLIGDVFGSRCCDCGDQLRQAIGLIACRGGPPVYPRGHKGHGIGIGLGRKFRAYALQ